MEEPKTEQKISMSDPSPKSVSRVKNTCYVFATPILASGDSGSQFIFLSVYNFPL